MTEPSTSQIEILGQCLSDHCFERICTHYKLRKMGKIETCLHCGCEPQFHQLLGVFVGGYMLDATTVKYQYHEEAPAYSASKKQCVSCSKPSRHEVFDRLARSALTPGKCSFRESSDDVTEHSQDSQATEPLPIETPSASSKRKHTERK